MYNVSYRSTDSAGNVEAGQIVTFAIDRTPPAVAIADIDTIKALVTRFAGMNGIDNDGIANSLHKKLSTEI